MGRNRGTCWAGLHNHRNVLIDLMSAPKGKSFKAIEFGTQTTCAFEQIAPGVLGFDRFVLDRQAVFHSVDLLRVGGFIHAV